jgi:hypothetical protein
MKKKGKKYQKDKATGKILTNRSLWLRIPQRS